MTDARLVDFDTDEIRPGLIRRHFNEQFSVAESDFHDSRRVPAEYFIEVEHVWRIGDTKLRPESFDGLLLSARQASGAADEAANSSL